MSSSRHYVPVVRGGGSCFNQARVDRSPQSQVQLRALQSDDKLNWRIQRADAVASSGKTDNRGKSSANTRQLPNRLRRIRSSASSASVPLPSVSSELLHIGSLRKSSKPFIGPVQPRIVLTDEEVQDYLRLAPRRAMRRPREDIVQAGMYEPARAPVGQAGTDRSEEKEKLQEAMAGTLHMWLEDRDKLLYSSNNESLPSEQQHKDMRNEKFSFEELVNELREREEFQVQMEQLGHAQEYSHGTRAEIIQILNMMKNTDREKFVNFMRELREGTVKANGNNVNKTEAMRKAESWFGYERGRVNNLYATEAAPASASNLVRAKMQHDSVASLLHS